MRASAPGSVSVSDFKSLDEVSVQFCQNPPFLSVTNLHIEAECQDTQRAALRWMLMNISNSISVDSIVIKLIQLHVQPR